MNQYSTLDIAMGRYRDWLIKYRTLVETFEDAVSGCTWLLPDRFSNSEILYESIYCFCGVLRIWHDYVLQQEVVQNKKLRA